MNHLLAFPPTGSWRLPPPILTVNLVPPTMTSALSRWASPRMKNLKRRCRERLHSIRPNSRVTNTTRKISTRASIGSQKTFKEHYRRLFRRSPRPDTTPGTPIVPHAPTGLRLTEHSHVPSVEVVWPPLPLPSNLSPASIINIQPQSDRGRNIPSDYPLNVRVIAASI